MYVLPPLPYAPDALEPILSADTLNTHHGKHHKGYVDKTNTLAREAGLSSRPLEEVVREAFTRGDKALFNNAAQAWNHAFFWQCMRPVAGEAPTGDLRREIDAAFGDLASLKHDFIAEGVGHFGSGWVWLVTGATGLKVISTHDANDTLVADEGFPLLVCDLWEHAYYLDHKNDREGFLERWFDGLANWSFAAAQLAAFREEGEAFIYAAPQPESTDNPEAEAPCPAL